MQNVRRRPLSRRKCNYLRVYEIQNKSLLTVTTTPPFCATIPPVRSSSDTNYFMRQSGAHSLCSPLSSSASATRIHRIRSSSRTSPPTSPPARRSPSSARPALARRPWSTCSCGSMRSPTAASELTVCRHLRSAARTCTSCSAWSCRTHGCLRAQSGKILSTICRT